MDIMNSFTTPVLPAGLGWTLTTYALKYIDEVEDLYGPRTGVLPYGGVELIPENIPHVWYPWEKHIVIRLTESVLQSIPQAIFQLSHEVVHVVCDAGPHNNANNLEEGLAAYFSKIATDRDSGDPTYADRALEVSAYRRPFELVNQLLGHDRDSIKKLRRVQPVLNSLTSSDFKDAGLSMPSTLISDLLGKFNK
jgi:hypothetical protein